MQLPQSTVSTLEYLVVPEPKNNKPQRLSAQTAEPHNADMPALPGSPALNQLAAALPNQDTQVFLAAIQRASAAAELITEASELLPLNDALVNAAREWIVSQGYSAPEIRENESMPGEPYKILVFGSGKNDYLNEAARDCAKRGQELVYHPLALLEDDLVFAIYDKLRHLLAVSHEILITGKLNEHWVHERTHGIFDSLMVAGIDHSLHGSFCAGSKSPLIKLPYGESCGFDELMAHKDELVHLVLQLNPKSDTLDKELLKKIGHTAYAGALIARILREGVIERVPECLDNLSALKEAPDAYLRTRSQTGTETRLEIGSLSFGCLKTYRIDLWDARDGLMVKIADEKMHGKLRFDLADPKWLQLRHELWRETVEKQLSVAQVIEHAHFQAIISEVRERYQQIKKFAASSSAVFSETYKLAQALGKLANESAPSQNYSIPLGKLRLYAQTLNLVMPCPEGVGPQPG